MISIRKQLFTIFLSIGLVMIFLTSMIVNVVIKENFEVYVSNNINQVGDRILELVQSAYNDGSLDEEVVKASIVESPVGNFAVSILDNKKVFLWGTTKDQFFHDLANEMENETYSNQTTYECVSKAIIKRSTGRIIIKPSSSSFKKIY